MTPRFERTTKTLIFRTCAGKVNIQVDSIMPFVTPLAFPSSAYFSLTAVAAIWFWLVMFPEFYGISPAKIPDFFTLDHDANGIFIMFIIVLCDKCG